jgi:mRNA interferase MazF
MKRGPWAPHETRLDSGQMSRSFQPLRGQVYFADLELETEKPVVVVSNNARNRALGTVLVARITTAPKPALRSIVPLPHGEPLTGKVLCDDLRMLAKSHLVRHGGGLSRQTMSAVDAGLKEALGLRH